MPAWWGKKLAASRKPVEVAAAGGGGVGRGGGAGEAKKVKEKARSFDEVVARRGAKAAAAAVISSAGSASSSSGFDSDNGAEKRGHPLPRPSALSAVSLPQIDHASASASVSSTSSYGSYDEAPELGFPGSNYRYGDPTTPRAGSDKQDLLSQQQQIAENLQHLSVIQSRGQPRQADQFNLSKGDPLLHANRPRSVNINGRCRSRSPGPTPGSHSPLARSPGPTPGSHSPLSSPTHPRLSAFHPDTDRQDEVKFLCHPLPLPPGSPSQSPSHSFRYSGPNENGYCLRSKWRKGKLLGRGTFGHVYVGFNCENGNMCAIKEVRVISDDQNSRESLRQLNQEISLLSQLSHPNIVQYHGSELAEDSLSVYLEYVSGGSIHKLLQDYGPFGEPVIRSYTRQILSGLAYLHERNTVHRDIKGANILVDPNGEIKLADFGMAKHINSCSNVLSFKGSPYWMAPEVIMNTNGYNLAVDIWSLGCTILEMATSKPPWSQYEGVAAIFKIGNSKSLPEIPDHISEEGKNFVTSCLQRDPSARPTATLLLDHPFVRDLGSKVPKINATKELHPVNDRILSPRGNQQLDDVEYGMRDRIGHASPLMHQRDELHPRVNMSLPVSPCSSPLRQFGAGAHRNYFLSPPHPSYVSAGSGFDTYPNYPSKIAISQARKQNGTTIFDVPFYKSQTPGGSPRASDLQSVYL